MGRPAGSTRAGARRCQVAPGSRRWGPPTRTGRAQPTGCQVGSSSHVIPSVRARRPRGPTLAPACGRGAPPSRVVAQPAASYLRRGRAARAVRVVAWRRADGRTAHRVLADHIEGRAPRICRADAGRPRARDAIAPGRWAGEGHAAAALRRLHVVRTSRTASARYSLRAFGRLRCITCPRCPPSSRGVHASPRGSRAAAA